MSGFVRICTAVFRVRFYVLCGLHVSPSFCDGFRRRSRTACFNVLCVCLLRVRLLFLIHLVHRYAIVMVHACRYVQICQDTAVSPL